MFHSEIDIPVIENLFIFTSTELKVNVKSWVKPLQWLFFKQSNTLLDLIYQFWLLTGLKNSHFKCEHSKPVNEQLCSIKSNRLETLFVQINKTTDYNNPKVQNNCRTILTSFKKILTISPVGTAGCFCYPPLLLCIYSIWRWGGEERSAFIFFFQCLSDSINVKLKQN